MSIRQALDDPNPHLPALRALRARLLQAMAVTAASPESIGQTPQVAAQLFRVVTALYHEEHDLDDESYVADLESICTTLAEVADVGPPAVLAQTSGVLLAVEADLEQARLMLKPQETPVDDIVARKPAALVNPRRDRGPTSDAPVPPR